MKLYEVIEKILKKPEYRYKYLGEYYGESIHICDSEEIPTDTIEGLQADLEFYFGTTVNVVFEDEELPRPRNKYYGIAYIDVGKESARITYGKIGDDVHCASVLGVGPFYSKR